MALDEYAGRGMDECMGMDEEGTWFIVGLSASLAEARTARSLLGILSVFLESSGLYVFRSCQ